MAKKAQTVPLLESSCIELAKYEPHSMQLLIKFHGYDRRYIYHGVPLEVVKRWVKHSRAGGSVGSFFINEIKMNYSYTRIEKPAAIIEFRSRYGFRKKSSAV